MPLDNFNNWVKISKCKYLVGLKVLFIDECIYEMILFNRGLRSHKFFGPLKAALGISHAVVGKLQRGAANMS